MANELRPEHVELVHFAETRVAALEHHGDPARLGESIGKFVAFRKAQHLHPSQHATFNLLYNDPTRVAPGDFRTDLCVAIDGPLAAPVHGIVEKLIPAGRCAKLRHPGTEDTLGQSIQYLRGRWFPASGQALRDFPMFLQRVRFFPEVPEGQAVVDVFLPLL